MLSSMKKKLETRRKQGCCSGTLQHWTKTSEQLMMSCKVRLVYIALRHKYDQEQLPSPRILQLLSLRKIHSACKDRCSEHQDV